MIQSSIGDTSKIQNGVQIMHGTFEDFSVEDILQVLGLSRQYLCLRVNDQQNIYFLLVVKAGQVLDARANTGDHGVSSLTWLMRHTQQRRSLEFSVLHLDHYPVGLSPIGTLSDFYNRARATIQQTQINIPANHPTSRAASPPSPIKLNPAQSSQSRPLDAHPTHAHTAHSVASTAVDFSPILEQLNLIITTLQPLSTFPQRADHSHDHLTSILDKQRQDLHIALDRLTACQTTTSSIDGTPPTPPPTPHR